jgi:hypothetical protein
VRITVPKKQVSQDRKARIAELQQQEKARENRVRIQIIAGCGALLLVLGAAIAFAIVKDRPVQPEAAISAIGVSAAAASCDPVTKDKTGGNGEHVDTSGAAPQVKYATVPPSSGGHYQAPEVSDRRFFTAADRPKMERLVHNLEHGYTVLWYDQQAGEAKKAQLEELAKVANTIDAASQKFIVSAWDPSYGELPAGKKFALSHWSATPGTEQTSVANQEGNRQLCGDLSGEVVKTFIDKHPRTSSPEPNGE